MALALFHWFIVLKKIAAINNGRRERRTNGTLSRQYTRQNTTSQYTGNLFYCIPPTERHLMRQKESTLILKFGVFRTYTLLRYVESKLNEPLKIVAINNHFNELILCNNKN